MRKKHSHDRDDFYSRLSLRIQLQLLRKVNYIMATLQQLNETIDTVAAGVDALEAAIVALKDQVAAGGTVSQQDLDALVVKTGAIVADLADVSDQGGPSVPPDEV